MAVLHHSSVPPVINSNTVPDVKIRMGMLIGRSYHQPLTEQEMQEARECLSLLKQQEELFWAHINWAIQHGISKI